MQKKLIGAAVASALGAPAIALAQTSTVQIYGTLYVEYSYIDQGTFANGSRQNVDILQTPGSNIGFKGEEKLGGGLAAWFQCESTADPRGQSQDGWCSRNSALGLKGGFGNIFIGNWDTPFKRTMGPTLVGSNQTGIWGSSSLMAAGATTVFGNSGRALFLRRQNNTINYDSPTFGGFRVMAAYTALNHATAVTAGAGNSKPRVLSLGAQYSAGPLFVSAGYERHNEFAGPTAAGTGDLDDHGWHLGAAYTWGPVRFGAAYTRQKFEHFAPAGATSRVNAWQVGVDWRIVGPHGLRAAYTRAGDMKGTPGAPAIGSTQSQSRPGVPVAGIPNDTGADLWQIRYVYSLSKRTEVSFGYAKLDNEGSAAAGGTYAIFGVGAGTPGNNQDAWGLGIRHRF